MTPRDSNASSWTAAGKVVPFVAAERRMLRIGTGWDAFEVALRENHAGVERAMFHLENVRGPILFLAAADDHTWDSKRLADLGMEYLKAHQRAFADKMVAYPNAGHGFLFSVNARTLTPAAFRGSGGTPAGNVAAALSAWPEIDAFLAQALSH
jgi:dienelactone hydrolase